MVNVLGYEIPIGLTGGTIITIVTWFVIIVIGGIGIALLTYYLMMRRMFNKDIIIFEKIGGRWEETNKDKAKIIKFGESGDYVFFTRRNKKYLPTPTIQTGRNKYWFAIREDGEWINIGLGDIDEQMRAIKAHFLDKEMRYARVALQRNLKERYQKPSFWSVYGGVIAFGILIVLLGVMIWLNFAKFIEVADSLDKAVSSANEVLEAAQKVVASLDNICGGSGLIPAG